MEGTKFSFLVRKIGDTDLILFTFCVDISRYSQQDLTRVANILVRSLDQSKTKLKLFIVFSNFDLQINNCPDYVEIRPFKQLISEIYKNSISMVTMSNAIDVIAEPIKSKKPINKFIALRTIIVLFFSILFFTTVRIILNLKDDFKI